MNSVPDSPDPSALLLARYDWRPVSGWQWEAEEATIAALLGTTGSLTRFLEQELALPLRLEVREQAERPCPAWAAQLLAQPAGANCLRRQIKMFSGKMLIFDADSWLPLGTLSPALLQALHDGQMPLGNLLLAEGLKLDRSDLSIGCRKIGCRRISCRSSAGNLWARRSVLRSTSGASALVCEYFFPEFISSLLCCR